MMGRGAAMAEAGKTGIGRRLLVPLDGSDRSERSLPYALAIAAPDAAVVLFRVVPEAEPIRGLMGNVEQTAEEVTERYRRIARQDLATAAAQLRHEPSASGLTVTEEVGTGLPVPSILAAAQAQGADTIVMASHGRGAAGRLAFGSVTDEVARASTVPVVVIRPDEDEEGVAPSGPAPLARVIVPLDGSDHARGALPVATELARRLNLPVRLVMAIDTPSLASGGLGMGAGVGVGLEGDDLFAQVQEEATAVLDEAGRDAAAAGVAVETATLIGSAGDAIIGDARSTDLVVLTSHGRSGISRLLMGSVAEQLVRGARGPVLLVPSPGRPTTAD